jgi:voltage-gated potassium channel
VKPHIRDPTRREHRIVGARTAVRLIVVTTLLFTVYAYAPLDGSTDPGPLIQLIVGLFAVAVVLVWQVRRILESPHPTLQAVEATVLAVALFIVVFSLIYLSIARDDAANFSEPLDRITAVYFTITVLATVGFGDIAARTHLARLTVAVQMMLDLTLGVVVVRLLFETARTTRLRRQQDEQPPD